MKDGPVVRLSPVFSEEVFPNTGGFETGAAAGEGKLNPVPLNSDVKECWDFGT